MSISHGSLENTILNAIWYIEENKLTKEITVNEVYEMVQRADSPRAYTTIKTVMDRLTVKSVLVRYKVGKKFFYKAAMDRRETTLESVKTLAEQFFGGSYTELLKFVERECSEYLIH